MVGPTSTRNETLGRRSTRIACEPRPSTWNAVPVPRSWIRVGGKKAFVRVNENRHGEIKFPLDAGADGIIIPMVNSAREAEEAVSHCLYPPRGNRGVGLGRAQNYGFGFDEHLKKNLNDLEIFVQCEHVDAVRDIKQITAIPGVTAVGAFGRDTVAKYPTVS